MREVDRLAHEIAINSARTLIEWNTTWKHSRGGVRWYNTADVGQIAREDVATAVRYLLLKRLLKRHSKYPALVKLLKTN